MPRELVFIIVLKHVVHKRAEKDTPLTAPDDSGHNIIVKAFHLSTNGFGAIDVVSKEALGNNLQPRKEIYGWGVSSLHDLGPLLHEVVKSVHVRAIDIASANSEDCIPKSASLKFTRTPLCSLLTDRVCNAVAEPLWMQHVISRVHHVVPHKLNRFGIDNLEMLTLNHRLHQVGVYQLSECPPLIAIMHDKQMVAFGDQFMGHKRMRSVAVDIALLVHRFLHKPPVRNNGHVPIAELEGVQATIFFRPFGESWVFA